MNKDRLAEVALLFHEAYERLAPSFGYQTREETREFDPDTPNGQLMIAVVGEVLGFLRTSQTAPDDADSGFSGDVVKRAEMLWANLPTGRAWTSLATYEKAAVIHALLSALPPAEDQVARLSSPDAIEAARREERERCAKVAETYWVEADYNTVGIADADMAMELCKQAAQAIRSLDTKGAG